MQIIKNVSKEDESVVYSNTQPDIHNHLNENAEIKKAIEVRKIFLQEFLKIPDAYQTM